MLCPLDGATLVMSERQGVEIDYCPQCRGVWLDRGELDKILDRAGAEAPAPPHVDRPVTFDRSDRPDNHGTKPYRRKKKEHWLMEIFD